MKKILFNPNVFSILDFIIMYNIKLESIFFRSQDIDNNQLWML